MRCLPAKTRRGGVDRWATLVRRERRVVRLAMVVVDGREMGNAGRGECQLGPGGSPSQFSGEGKNGGDYSLFPVRSFTKICIESSESAGREAVEAVEEMEEMLLERLKGRISRKSEDVNPRCVDSRKSWQVSFKCVVQRWAVPERKSAGVASDSR